MADASLPAVGDLSLLEPDAGGIVRSVSGDMLLSKFGVLKKHMVRDG